MTGFNEFLAFLNVHFSAIVQIVGFLGVIILAHANLKNVWVKKAVQDAVLFADQYKVAQVKLGKESPSGDILKAMAVQFVVTRYPGVDVTLIADEIEAALNLLNMQKAIPVIVPVEHILDSVKADLIATGSATTTTTATT
jgi:hypothetical protein